MTEYWVSQGNKWCDFCKIYIANNPLSIRTHELGQRHKDSVAKRLDSMRKENVAKEKEQKEAARALEQIEAKAKRSYQKDLAAVREVRESNSRAVEAHEESSGVAKCLAASGGEWEYDNASGYYYNQTNGYYYDPSSGFYYSDAIGKWVTQEEVFATSQGSSEPKQKGSFLKKPLSASAAGSSIAEDRGGGTKSESGPAPGLVVQGSSLNPTRSVKGASSSIAVTKRKRQDEKKPKVVSKEEAAALKAREAAKKRMEEREKPLLGLYKSY
ncbi:zinc finger protein [Macleaya cordata]|uniref:Zinc finger protein n=1 Tax=Macleaya cordata TaxID=56857 RepID=A0A200PNM5_MACCD|nr:zinc finger protein [Macleaya cordata]